MPPRKKAAADDNAAPKTRAKEIPWASEHSLTWAVIEYFNDHPDFRRKYFSDSSEAAQNDGRKKVTGKDSKASMNHQIAEYVFSTHAEYQEAYRENPTRFSMSTGQRLTRLRATYRGHVTELGATGAGLRRDEVQEGSALYNSHQKILQTFPYWYELDAFWHELPNVNPIAVSCSQPGTDHVATAKKLFSAGNDEDLGEEERQLIDDDPMADCDDSQSATAMPAADDTAAPSDAAARAVSPSVTDGTDDIEVTEVTVINPLRAGTASSSSRASSTRASTPAVPVGMPAKVGTPAATAKAGTPTTASKASGKTDTSASAAKAAAASAAKTPAQRKDKDAISKLTSMREADAERQLAKRKLESEEALARINAAQAIKRQKLEYKMRKSERKQELKLAQLELRKEQLRAAAAASAHGLPASLAGLSAVGLPPGAIPPTIAQPPPPQPASFHDDFALHAPLPGFDF